MVEPKITELTAEAIRKSGLETAENIRSYAKKVREEGEAMAAYADEVAQAVIQASSHAADRIAGYMKRCEEAREAIRAHEKLLTELPKEVVVASEPVANLDDLERDIARTVPPRAPLSRPVRPREEPRD